MVSPNYPIILSADDDENAHLLLAHAARKADLKAKLVCVDDGGELINYLAGNGRYQDRNAFPLPSLILLDLKMPKVSGFDVLEHLRCWPKFHVCPIVVFSSSANEQDSKTAYALGCDNYIVKPTSFLKLVDLLMELSLRYLQRPPATTLNLQPISNPMTTVGSACVDAR